MPAPSLKHLGASHSALRACLINAHSYHEQIPCLLYPGFSSSAPPPLPHFVFGPCPGGSGPSSEGDLRTPSTPKPPGKPQRGSRHRTRSPYKQHSTSNGPPGPLKFATAPCRRIFPKMGAAATSIRTEAALFRLFPPHGGPRRNQGTAEKPPSSPIPFETVRWPM